MIFAAARSSVADYMLSENRFKMLTKSKPEEAKKLFALAQSDADRRWKFYQFMQTRDCKFNLGKISGLESSPPKLPNPDPLNDLKLWT